MNTLRTRPWALLFFVSLAVNIFFGGMLTARWMNRRRAPLMPRGDVSAQSGRQGPDGTAFEQRLRGTHGAEFDARMKALHEARGKVRASLQHEPFDENAARVAFGELRASSSAVQQLVHETMLETAQSLTPQQRSRLAKSLERMPNGPGPWKGRMAPMSVPSSSP